MGNGASSYRRFLDGDESAFNEIMEELFRSLVFFINGYVHDIHAAEDIAIDAFSDLVVHRHRYNFKGSHSKPMSLCSVGAVLSIT